MRAAIYARVSTTDQHNEIQVRELTEYVARRGWTLAKVYEDTVSGAKARRPGLDALMADARARRIDAVIVWKLDRFGRSLVLSVVKNSVHKEMPCVTRLRRFAWAAWQAQLGP